MCRPSRISPSSGTPVITLPSPRHPSFHRMLPITAVEIAEFERRNIDAVETAHIDVDLIRVGARNVERMNAAGGAERVLRDAGIEAVGRQRILAAQQLEQVPRHNQMQEALL